jgi:glycosyltransferase involved in cell wall biosynthesis
VTASVNLITVRKQGLDWQLYHLSKQTFKDFEVVLVDGYYEERKEVIANKAKELGLNIQHHPLPVLSYITSVNIASNRNTALSYSKGDVVIFVDDHQIIPENFVERHIRTTHKGVATVGRQYALYRKRDNYFDFSTFSVEEIEHGDGRADLGWVGTFVHGGAFWTNNASVWRADALEVNGFDERYNGGTAGEDTDFGTRLTTIGIKIFFSTDALVWHVDHSINPLPGKKLSGVSDKVDKSLCNHNRTPFTCNAYSQGDFNLIDSGSLHTWRDSNGIKYYICKNCGEIGHIDSIELVNKAVNKTSVVAPTNLFNLAVDAPDKVRDYVCWPITTDILLPLISLYKGTQYTYYQKILDLYYS